MDIMKPIVIIPAYNPDDKLIGLVENLYKMGLRVVVVNDGSGQEYSNVFKSLKSRYICEIYSHVKNKGKGAALKTGIQYAAANYPECSGFVTADADGQHTPEDILKVVNALEGNPDSLVLGTRNFRERGIPYKSLYGNRITSFIYLLSTGKHCADTQTGLRGIPKKYKALSLSVPGEKYEYEMNLLLEMGRKGIPFVSVSIKTIYLENNASSHFNPVKDSAIIYFNILKYSLSSLLSAMADLSLFTVFVNLLFGSGSSGIFASTVIARVISGCFNFTINKLWVFESRKRSVCEGLGYLMLFCFQMMTSWFLVSSLSGLPFNLTLIKILVDTGLFLISYEIQKNFIFTDKEERKAISE